MLMGPERANPMESGGDRRPALPASPPTPLPGGAGPVSAPEGIGGDSSGCNQAIVANIFLSAGRCGGHKVSSLGQSREGQIVAMWLVVDFRTKKGFLPMMILGPKE
ncbi:hypothetical protein NDU88_006767 [Pleurodeles waltl]|uniref:Uncharacterized protein n=1 Tax=Pleurodeles waltl TaxID=8319 RepID=A0AAV7SQH7_PLEWA|nr:hypothetical protein NDU88_006767 [Pleurodeles waltl]